MAFHHRPSVSNSPPQSPTMSIPAFRTQSGAQLLNDMLARCAVDTGRLLAGESAFVAVATNLSSFQQPQLPNEALTKGLLQMLSPSVSPSEDDVGKILRKLSLMSAAMDSARRSYNQKVSQLTAPSDAAPPTSMVALKARLDKVVKQYDKELNRGNKRGAAAEKSRASLHTHQRILQKAACEYLLSALNLQQTRSADLALQLTQLFTANLQYMQEMAAILAESLPKVAQVAHMAKTLEQQTASQRHEMQQLLVRLDQEIAACMHQEGEIEKANKESRRRKSSIISIASFASPPLGAALVKPQTAPASSAPASPVEAVPPPPPAESIAMANFVHSHTAPFLRVILATHGNDKCADCGRSKITHIISDVGVLVCKDCAAVHKELAMTAWSNNNRVAILRPTHAGAIKDFSIDVTITRQDLFLVRAIGNTMANEALEGGCTSSIFRNADDNAWRRVFINDKYHFGHYARKREDRCGNLVNALREGNYADCGVCPILLLEILAGAEPQSSDGIEALHLAIAEDNVAAVDFLLRLGVSPDAMLGGHTGLQVAAQLDRLDSAKVLLAHGANLALVSSRGESAVDVAQRCNSIECSYVFAAVADGVWDIKQTVVNLPTWLGDNSSDCVSYMGFPTDEDGEPNAPRAGPLPNAASGRRVSTVSTASFTPNVAGHSSASSPTFGKSSAVKFVLRHLGNDLAVNLMNDRSNLSSDKKAAERRGSASASAAPPAVVALRGEEQSTRRSSSSLPPKLMKADIVAKQQEEQHQHQQQQQQQQQQELLQQRAKQEEEAAALKRQEEEQAAMKKKQEAEQAAMKKKQDEEAAAMKKKQDEEAAAMKKKQDEEAAAAQAAAAAAAATTKKKEVQLTQTNIVKPIEYDNNKYLKPRKSRGYNDDDDDDDGDVIYEKIRDDFDDDDDESTADDAIVRDDDVPPPWPTTEPPSMSGARLQPPEEPAALRRGSSPMLPPPPPASDEPAVASPVEDLPPPFVPELPPGLGAEEEDDDDVPPPPPPARFSGPFTPPPTPSTPRMFTLTTQPFSNSPMPEPHSNNPPSVPVARKWSTPTAVNTKTVTNSNNNSNSSLNSSIFDNQRRRSSLSKSETAVTLAAPASPSSSGSSGAMSAAATIALASTHSLDRSSSCKSPLSPSPSPLMNSDPSPLVAGRTLARIGAGGGFNPFSSFSGSGSAPATGTINRFSRTMSETRPQLPTPATLSNSPATKTESPDHTPVAPPRRRSQRSSTISVSALPATAGAVPPAKPPRRNSSVDRSRPSSSRPPVQRHPSIQE